MSAMWQRRLGQRVRRVPPGQEAIMDALDAAEECLRTVASDWRNVPTSVRVATMRGADRALTILLRAGRR